MNYRAICIVLCSGMLFACSSQDRDDSYVGWVCDGPRNSDDWSCEMREISDGQSVVGKLSEDREADQGDREQSDTGRKTAVVGLPKQDWRKQLPSLTSEPAETGDSDRPRRIRSKAPRVAEPLSEGWPELQGEEPEPSDEQPVVVQTVDEPVQPLQSEDVSGARSGYTMQLGAFADKTQLDAFVATHHLSNLPVRNYQTFSREKHWQVLTWGEFDSPEAAREAWQRISEQYPDVAPWVRSVSSLDNAAGVAAEADG